MNDLAVSINKDAVARANAVQRRLKVIGTNMVTHFLETCQLLREAQEQGYHTTFNFTNFGDWVEQGSGLDISSRQAYYLIAISTKADELGVTLESLRGCKISVLKEIFTLQPADYAAQMVKLLESAGKMTLAEAQAAVNNLKETHGEERKAFLTLRVEESVKHTIEEAIELARMRHGSVEEAGDSVDISPSRALEYICVAYIQDPRNYSEEEAGGYEQEEIQEED